MKSIVYASVLITVLLAGAAIAANPAFADHDKVTVKIVEGSGSLGCEQTETGCYDPTEVTIDVGGEVTWENPDSARHTVTSGTPASDNVAAQFDSGLFGPGSTFTHKFEEAGTFDYFCQVHPWMEGTVIVQEAGATEGDGMMGGQMSGEHFDITMEPSPFDTTKSDTVNFKITAKADELKTTEMSSDTVKTAGKIDHLDYRIMVSKDGKEIFNKKFHDHDGNLEINFKKAKGDISSSGGKEDSKKTMTGPYQVSGPIFDENGNYKVTAQVVGIEFQALPEPITESFSARVVPEFGPIAAIVLAGSIGAIVALTMTKGRFLLPSMSK